MPALLMATGKAYRADEAFIAGLSLPCGQFGSSEAGMVIIQAIAGGPD